MRSVARMCAFCLVIAARLLWAQEPPKAPATPNGPADLAVPSAGYKASMDHVAAEMPQFADVDPAKPTEVAALRPTKDQPFVNSLGMKFVPVPETEALFCIWDTRVQDYAGFARVANVGDAWKSQEREGVPFSREPEDPVVGVSWEDANAFCQWLTDKETAEGRLPRGMKYRLPTDEEWSRAVGLAKEPGATPKNRSGKSHAHFPWGMNFPPSKPNVGNYADAAYHGTFTKSPWIKGYTDGYAATSPVGSFPPNQYGLYDMGGNVWQWCEDLYEPGDADRVLRGASFDNYIRDQLLSSFRSHRNPGVRVPGDGFRCVLERSAR